MILYVTTYENGRVDCVTDNPDLYIGSIPVEYNGDMETLNQYIETLKVVENELLIDYEWAAELEVIRNAPKPKSTLELMADALDKAKPTIEKQGFHLELTYNEGMLVWEFVADEQPGGNDGTDYLRPITYIPGMSVTAGLWYTDGEDIWECIQTGENSEWTTQWFDIIAV